MAQSRQHQRNARARARYDTPRAESLLERPTHAGRLRQLIAYSLRVPGDALTDAHIQRWLGLLPQLCEALMAVRHRESRYPYTTYLDAYFLADPPPTSRELGEDLGLSPTGVRNQCHTIYRIFNTTLNRLTPELVAAAQQQLTAITDRAFWERVEQHPDGCWIWQGATDLGYGVVKRQGRKQQAHRYAYTLAVGTLTEGLHLYHTCRVRNCVNPAHLYEAEPGTIHD